MANERSEHPFARVHVRTFPDSLRKELTDAVADIQAALEAFDARDIELLLKKLDWLRHNTVYHLSDTLYWIDCEENYGQDDGWPEG